VVGMSGESFAGPIALGVNAVRIQILRMTRVADSRQFVLVQQRRRRRQYAIARAAAISDKNGCQQEITHRIPAKTRDHAHE